MAGTYLDLKTRIAAEILRTDQTTNIANAINQAIEFYAPRRFWFNEQRQTGVCVPSNEYVAFPSGLRVIDALYVTVSGVGYALTPRSFADIEEWAQAVNTATQPTDYATLVAQVRLYPKPNSAYPLTFVGVFDEAALSADGDSNHWTTSGQDLIVGRVKWKLGTILRNDSLIQSGRAEEAEAYDRLIAETTRRTSTGRIEPSL